VLIVGCGFGGLAAVQRLSKAEVDITLVDRTNHHLFQPLLYQVATATLSAPVVAAPIRHVLRRQIRRGNLTVLQGEVAEVDAAARCVRLADGGRLAYDHLIVAAGATHSYFGHDDWAAVAPGLKTLADAFDIRARVIGAFERAERCEDPHARQAWLNFVIVGAGPTGVELAGAVVEIARHTLADEFRRIDSRQSRVVLIEGSPRVLGAFDASLSDSARRQLERLGVEVRTGCRVTAIDADGVSVLEGAVSERLPAHTVLWAAGVAASPLGRRLAAATGATADRSGRLEVQPDLSLPGHPEISVIGDLANAYSYRDPAARDRPTAPAPGAGHSATPDPRGPRPVPGVSPAAKQMGRTAADNLLARLRGAPTRAFRYRDYGALATIGRKAAVVQLEAPVVGHVKWSGFAAWLFWLFAHVFFLIDFRSRVIVLFYWAWAYWTFDRHARVIAEPATPLDAAPPPAEAKPAA
jgi:NADH dehydrogenase